MPFPQTPSKHAARPYVTPRQLLDYHAQLDGLAGVTAPKAVILTWQPRLERLVRDRRDCGQLPRGSFVASVGPLLLRQRLAANGDWRGGPSGCILRRADMTGWAA